jgi:hypothetical protein
MAFLIGEFSRHPHSLDGLRLQKRGGKHAFAFFIDDIMIPSNSGTRRLGCRRLAISMRKGE